MRLSTLCMLGNVACTLPSADFYQNQHFRRKSFRNTTRVSNSLDIWSGPNLGPNCLQKLSGTQKNRLNRDGSFEHPKHM